VNWCQPPQIDRLQSEVSQLIHEGSNDEADAIMREACLWPGMGLWVLLRYGLGRQDAHNQWVFDRCCEVQANPDGYLDLWAREHWKSSIITNAKTIQDVLADPDITVGIFSHTRPIAKAFLRQIKGEFERNERLKRWFPDVLWADPQKESPKWSEDEGIVVKRKSNPKEATIEAWGVVDGQPTSKHFKKLVFDDVVTKESVTSPEMMLKTTESLQLAYNLGTRGGAKRFIGTRYHANDSYKTVLDSGTAKPRLYPATENGLVDGKPVFLTRDELDTKRREMGPYIYGAQMLLDPTADDKQGFKEEWLEYASGPDLWRGHNLVILVDAASSKKKTSDYTSIWVLGLGPDRKVYVHDMVRDRLSLTERADRLIALHRHWFPRAPVMAVGYERYGMMADIEHIRDLQERENYRFKITELGGQMPKLDRIRRLVPWFEQKRILLRPTLPKTDYEGREVDLTKAFIEEEYKAFPVATHDDMLDALSRFLDEDLPIRFPLTLADMDEDEEPVQGRSAITGY
jgi:predicted phage terminase large subunit-like protein